MSEKQPDHAHMSNANPLQFVLRIIKGAVLGVGAILPGISGGVLSVVFGIYRPLMEFLAHPIAQFKRSGCSFADTDRICVGHTGLGPCSRLAV